MGRVFKSNENDMIVPCSCHSWECGQMEFAADWVDFPDVRLAYGSIRSRPPCSFWKRLKSAWTIMRGGWMEHNIELDSIQTRALSDWLASVHDKPVENKEKDNG